MKNEILREKLKNLSSQQLKLINDYCDNNMLKLKKISCDAFFRYGIPQYEHDELYDDKELQNKVLKIIHSMLLRIKS